MRAMLLFCLCACAPSLLAAQDPTPTFTVDLFGLSALYNAPPWVTSPTGIDQVEVSRQNGVSPNGTRVFILEYIPTGEVFENWTQLYAIHAETPLSGTVDGYMGGVFASFDGACNNAIIQSANAVPPNMATSIIYCPSYLGNPVMGEVAFFHMQMVGEVLVRSYYHRRVPAYDLNVGLPLSDEEIAGYFASVAALSLQ